MNPAGWELGQEQDFQTFRKKEYYYVGINVRERILICVGSDNSEATSYRLIGLWSPFRGKKLRLLSEREVENWKAPPLLRSPNQIKVLL